MGENNASLGMRPGARPDLLLAAAAAYQGMYGGPDASVPATYNVLYMIGWEPAPTQPLPKARGSVPKGFAARPGGSAPPALG